MLLPPKRGEPKPKQSSVPHPHPIKVQQLCDEERARGLGNFPLQMAM